MEEITTTFEPRSCPDCGKQTGLVNLGQEPPREVCGRFGCNWEGITLRKPSPVRTTTDSGKVLVE